MVHLLYRTCDAYDDAVLVEEVPLFVTTILGRLYQTVASYLLVSTAGNVTCLRPLPYVS